MTRSLSFLLACTVLVSSCRTDKSLLEEDEPEPEVIDEDGDGFTEAEDCDDGNSTIHPDAEELCDEVDNDCDGEIDEEVQSSFYADADGDGYGDSETMVEACEAPSGYIEDSSDCDDDDADTWPEADERCDGVDNDCDGEVDEDVVSTWYADSDGDGHGDPESTIESCDPSSGYVSDATDCDDADPTVSPVATELCDDIDNDCDGEIDEDDAADTPTWYADSDGDGYGDIDATVETCDAPSGYVSDSSDCDDSTAAISPDGVEICDGLDNDCDGSTDEDDALDASTWYADSDGDGFGDGLAISVSCAPGSGYVSNSEDCNDSDATISPVATELCDGLDNDCDGSTDEDDAADASTWYADADSDGFGDAAASSQSCDAPSGSTSDDTDCDDSDGDIHPSAEEICDGLDNDCDGDIDDDDSSLSGASTWYVDIDGDGYGSDSLSTTACEQPASFASSSDDCDDASTAAYPGADEICDGQDNDCDGDTDEDLATDASTWYADGDSDGYGDSSISTAACDAPSGYVSDATDCDDADDTVYPSADELCDGLDNDCDGVLDPDSEVLGASEECPALDCQDVQDTVSGAADDNYWIDPTGSGSAFEIFCDLSTEGGGWTLVANIDDINDPWLLAQDDTWESTELRNQTTLPSYSTDISVTAKYESWTTIDVTDVYVYYKNDGASFLCEGLDLNDTLDEIFSTTPDSDECVSECTSWTDNRLDDEVESPVGLNCSDANEGWMSSSYTNAENARIGGRSIVNSCCVVNAYAGAAGDRGFDTSNLNKTWGAYSEGESEDNNILIFVR